MEQELTVKIAALAVIGGLVPPLVWLWFWLREDSLHPEPKGLIILSFIAGMAAIPLVFPIQEYACALYVGPGIAKDAARLICTGENPAILVFAWAAIEELIKFALVYVVALHSRFFDEPIDAVMYLITGALGFAAMENFLFFVSAAQDSGTIAAVLNGHVRFIGATVLHVVASGTVGIALALSFYARSIVKAASWSVGIATAVYLHTLFNLSIIKSASSDTVKIFSIFWILTFVIILLLEKIKHSAHPRRRNASNL